MDNLEEFGEKINIVENTENDQNIYNTGKIITYLYR